jgi:hypothetical protein
LDSLSHAALTLEWSLEGSGTQLEGSASLQPNRISVNGAEGRASWRLVNSLVPDLPITCEAQARVAIERAVFSETIKGLAGELRSGPSVCVGRGTTPVQPVEVPPLLAVATLEADSSRVEVTTVEDKATPLARATLTA